MKNLILLALLFTTIVTHSQSVKVVYAVRVDKNVLDKSSAKSKDFMKMIMEEANSQKFNLFITKKTSAFVYQNDQLSKSDDKMIAIAKSAFSSPNTIYFDFDNRRIIEKTDDAILIEDKVIALNWKITNETKKINGYQCYKAMLSLNPINDVHNVVAWFCPSLPYNNGPKHYYGLPGLILELKEYATTYLATKIELDTKESKISFPKGKTISRNEYEKRLKRQMGY